MKTRLLALIAVALLALAIMGPAVAFADPSPPPCSPGQHGNPNPGFKPGAC